MRESLVVVSKAVLPVVLTVLSLGLPAAYGQTASTTGAFAGAAASSMRAEDFNALPGERTFSAGATITAHEPDISNAQTSSGNQSGASQTNTPSTLPGSALPVPTLTPGEKLRYGLKQAFYTPSSYFGPAFAAGVRQFNEVDVPAKTGGDKFADYMADYARTFGTASTTEIFATGVYPALFKQNPKYVKLKDLNGRASRGARFWYAVSNVVITVGDNNRRQLNYSRLGGNLTGAALANIWERDTPNERNSFGVVTEINRRRGASATFRRFGISLGFAALANVIEEFSGLGR